MRVIAGQARSLPLKCPVGDGTRPTTDRIKETLFNILQPWIPGAVFADFFAGSGAVGIEALSRGASKAYFIENAKEALGCLQHNLTFTKLADRASVLSCDAIAATARIREDEVDVIFMDPPYGKGLEMPVLAALSRMRYVTQDTLIIVEADLTTDFGAVEDYGFEVTRQKLYRTNRHVFMKRKSQ